MGFELVSFEIYLRFKNHELLLHTFCVRAKEMIGSKMFLELFVVIQIYGFEGSNVSIEPVTNVTSLVPLS